MRAVSNKNFYSNLPSFDEFSRIAELDQYEKLPDDWVLLISDVVGSTSQISAGRYKQVNMVGAASIIAVLNIADDLELPFSFGGDGGTIAVPPELEQKGRQALRKLKAGCQSKFGMELRAAAFTIGDLRKQGGIVLVRKFHLHGDNYLAMFAGEGMDLAERYLKSKHAKFDKYKLDAAVDEEPDLEGLSCRWEPLHNRRGTMLTLIIRAVGDGKEDLAGEVADVLGGPISGFTPVRNETLRFRFPPRGLGLEVAAQSSKVSLFRRTSWALFTSAMQYLCEKFRIKIGDYDGTRYRDELIASTDFRKFDGALRMVLDLSLLQADHLEQWLEKGFHERRLVFGTWRSDAALMTCMLFDLDASRHLHLIDGADGGYTLAARAYKRRVAEIKKP